jgi:hypothetical protein
MVRKDRQIKLFVQDFYKVYNMVKYKLAKNQTSFKLTNIKLSKLVFAKTDIN